jgi:hypothetical protein
MRIVIHLRDEYGGPSFVSTEYFDFVALFVSGPMTSYSQSHYLSNVSTMQSFVDIGMQGDYTIQVQLLQSAFDASTNNSTICYTVDEMDSVVKDGIIKLRTQRFPEAIVNVKPICTADTSVELFFQGAYVLPKGLKFNGLIKSIRPDGTPNSLTLDASVWMPKSCQLRIFDTANIKTCLMGKWIAFVGDSTAEELALLLVKLLGVPFSSDWQPFFEVFRNERIFDAGI